MDEKMKLYFEYVVNVMVFDKEGKFLANLDTLKVNSLSYNTEYLGNNNSNSNCLLIKDLAINTNMLGQLGEEEKLSDYDNLLGGNAKTFAFGSKSNIPCKIICSGSFKEGDTHKNIIFKIEIPNAEMVNTLNIQSNNEHTFGFDYKFYINPFNDKKDLFKLHIGE